MSNDYDAQLVLTITGKRNTPTGWVATRRRLIDEVFTLYVTTPLALPLDRTLNKSLQVAAKAALPGRCCEDIAGAVLKSQGRTYFS